MYLYQRFFLLIYLLSLSTSVFSDNFDDSEIMHIDYPDWFIDNTFKDFPEDLENAIADGKKGLMFLFTTEGCSYCDKFIQKSLGDPDIARAVQRNFDTVGLEIFNDANMLHPDGSPTRVVKFAEAEGVQFSPTLLFFGKNGKAFLKLTGYQKPERFKQIISFFEERKPGENFKDYVQRKSSLMTPKVTYKLKDDPLFLKPPYLLAAKKNTSDKPMLLIFETDNCVDCRDLHANVLSLPEVRQALTEFNVIRLDKNDAKSTITVPSGNQITPANWYELFGFNHLPALVFFSTEHQSVLETDALFLRQRMLNSINFVLEKAYEKNWTYQRFARQKGIERLMARDKKEL